MHTSSKTVTVSHSGGVYSILMFAAFLSMVIMWWGLQSGKQQSCVNSNHVVSIMCLKLSLRNQSALGGLQANQHFCRWTGRTGWLAAYSVCQQRIEEKSNAALLQTGQERFYDFFRMTPHHQKYTHAHTNAPLFILRKLDLPLCLCLLQEQNNHIYFSVLETRWAVLMVEKTSEESPAVHMAGVKENDGGLSATSMVNRRWFPVFADCCYDLKQPQWVTHWDPNIVSFLESRILKCGIYSNMPLHLLHKEVLNITGASDGPWFRGKLRFDGRVHHMDLHCN